ncbi:MAG: DUF3330 domain-containing protein [Sideroxydans sp.]|nr:DUF3330 domain-containing protein [Sideroxydans sp.]
MNRENQFQVLSESVKCAVCKKEVPRADAVDFEVGDYVAHFCGLECYAQWQDRRVTEDEPDSMDEQS